MVKKGKEKSGVPAARPQAQASSSSKKKNTKAPPPAEDDFIVFTNSTQDPKPRRSGASAPGPSNTGSGGPDQTAEGLPGPPKPTAKQIVGGASWTGKLPVNLLSEHCQRQKWSKPEYDMHKTPDGFSSMVTLSARNPKTQETQKLPSFKIPPSHKHLLTKPTALEARHAAATYALFRVCSMKNIHMTLPPDHRSLWKEFEALKKQDVKDDKAWMYDADPFTAARAREDAKAAAEKKRDQQQAAKEKAANMPGASGLVLRSMGGKSGGSANPMRGWMSVPKIEMGSRTRSQLEDLLRRETVWNPHGVDMPPSARTSIVKEFTGLGFRPSHIEEAVGECKDREETLEWLLIHVPEDDLPKWALPESYSAGISVGATDLKREGALKRLSQSGYAPDLCRKVYDNNGGDEGRSAEALQRLLRPSSSGDASKPQGDKPFDNLSSGSPEQCWEDEMSSLESVMGEQFNRLSHGVCQVRLQSVRNGPKKDVDTLLQFRKSPHYPSQVIISIITSLPAYIKLSIIKRTLAYINESLSEEEMKLYFIIDWVEQNINYIIEKPGSLRDISAVASAASEVQNIPVRKGQRRVLRHPKPTQWKVDAQSRDAWLKRQETAQYQRMLTQRQTLPAWQVRDTVVRTVKDNQVTIISGETGSGKSTQSVQFILDDLYDQGYGNLANMIVTQPRRISALGLADRVSEERCSQVGQEVGYTIRGENRTSSRTRITFVTTGVLLRRLQTSGGRTDDIVASLADVSHIVIDEVHERSLDTDFLLSIVRDVLRERKDLKLILMSATLDSATFKSYFISEGLAVGTVEIAGRTYPVQDYYLDDVIHMTGFTGSNSYAWDDERSPEKSAPSYDAAKPDVMAKTIGKLGGRISYDLLLETTRAIDTELVHTNKSGGILIFLPGVAEINRTLNALRSLSSLHVLPLHASLETKDQRRVFAAPPPGKRKVVVATNVAETSITIDDIVVVIDSGKVKETSYDPANNMRKLEENWASRAACAQRRGRAGRVQAGKCYKLFTHALEQDKMAARPEPEIRRVPLEQLCLSVRAMGIRDVSGFLARAPTPPDATAVDSALDILRHMGALDGDELTALGTQLAMIPADLRCGKLMVHGAMFGCLDESVTIAAILSSRSPFLAPAERREQAKEAKMRFARGDGDLMTDLRAVQAWDEQARVRAPQRHVRAWCDDNFLSWNTLSDIAAARTQYYAALGEIGIVLPSASTNPNLSSSSSSAPPALVRALTAAAFSPQIARIQFPDKKFAASMAGAVELDPEARTIRYFTRDQGRVFVHPGSTLFDAQGFGGNAAFVSYFTMMQTSKIFVRDLTPFNAYTLLLFSGTIELDTLGRGLVVDGWLRLRGWARIGVLVSRLRGMVDDIIAMKVENPGMDLSKNEVIKLVSKLVELDGLDA